MKKLTKEQFINDLTKLVSFETLTSDISENKKALDFIESKINKKAIIKRIKNEGIETLVASNTDTLNPDVCFLVHVDVVAGKREQFNMVVKKGVAYGRGVSDMKFSIPIGYQLLNNLIRENSKLSFAFVITTDEETGGFKGGAYLAKNYKFEPKSLIVPDGGDNFVFVNKSKGVCALRIDSKGIPAHSSMIWDGKNALNPLVELCNMVLKKYKKNNEKESWKTTVNLGKLQGGVSANQVCPEAYAILDFRFPETTTFNEILDEVTTMARKIDPTLTISTHSIGSPTAVDMKNPAVKIFLKSFRKNIGKLIKVKPTYGASDARHFAYLNIPILMIKPTGGDIHCDTENINIDSCLLFYAALESFLKQLESKKADLHW
jgi:acetylornithine deacetylase/succinyl-diaminopimelate desuccinylase-like protein